MNLTTLLLTIFILCNLNCTESPKSSFNEKWGCLTIGNNAKVEFPNHSIHFKTIGEKEIELYKENIENIENDEIGEFFDNEFEADIYSEEGQRFILELIYSEEYISREDVEDIDPPETLKGVINLINKTKSKYFKRRGNELIIETEQKKVTFKDITTNENTWIKHSFIMFYPSINSYLIKKHEFVDGLHKNTQGILINKETGKETELWDCDFAISPDKKKIALTTFAFGAEYSGKRGLQIFSKTRNGLELHSEVEICDWEPSLYGWIDNEKLLIKTINDSDSDYGIAWIEKN